MSTLTRRTLKGTESLRALKRNEDSKEDPITKTLDPRSKEDPKEDIKEDLITNDPKENLLNQKPSLEA